MLEASRRNANCQKTHTFSPRQGQTEAARHDADCQKNHGPVFEGVEADSHAADHQNTQLTKDSTAKAARTRHQPERSQQGESLLLFFTLEATALEAEAV